MRNQETTMIAYHGREALKAAVLSGIAAHEAADRVMSGTYAEFEDGSTFSGGCAVGCTLESLRVAEGLDDIEHSDHALYERYLGVPEALARLEDSIFEGLDGARQLAWPREFAEAIAVGADLSMVVPTWLHWLLTDADGSVQAQCRKHERIATAVKGVTDLFARWIETGAKPSVTEWREASRAAAAAAAYADAYAYAAYADAAAAAAYADAYAYAAYAAADAAAYAAYADAADAAAAAYAAAYAYAAYAAADAAAYADAADAAADAAAAAGAADAAARVKSRERQADGLLTILRATR